MTWDFDGDHFGLIEPLGALDIVGTAALFQMVQGVEETSMIKESCLGFRDDVIRESPKPASQIVPPRVLRKEHGTGRKKKRPEGKRAKASYLLVLGKRLDHNCFLPKTASANRFVHGG